MSGGAATRTGGDAPATTGPAPAHAGPTPPARSAPGSGALVALAFLTALALAHHHTLVLLAAPAFVVALVAWWRAARAAEERRRAIVTLVAAGLAGLLPLLWLPLAARHTGAVVWGDPSSVRGFLSLLLRVDYGTLRLDPEQAGMQADRSHLAIYAESLPGGLGVLPLLLAIAGAWALWQRSRALAVALGAYALAQAWFFTRIGFPSNVPVLRGVVERFYILPDLVLAFLAGLGAVWVATRFAARPRAALGALTGLAAAALVVPLVTRFATVDQRGNRFTETLGRAVLASTPQGAALFVQGDLFHNALTYLTRVEHQREDVAFLDQELMTYAWYVRRARVRYPDLLPAFGRAQHIALRDGRRLDGLAIARGDSVDVLWEQGQATVAAGEVASATDADARTMFRTSRAKFHGGPLVDASEDRYSGLPGSRNLLWFDHLAGRRPVAMIGVKDGSYALRYELTPVGFVEDVSARGAGPGVAEQAERALRVLEQAPLDPWFRAYDPMSFEAAEKWRFLAFVSRTALVLCQPDAAPAITRHPAGHAALLAFARRFEALDPTPEPQCLRALGLLRAFDPAARDAAQARADLERYMATSAAAANDAEAAGILARLPGRSAAP